MISPALLERLREGNVDLSLDGDELVVRTAGERLSPELIALLRENKPGLLELLRSNTYAAAIADGAPLIELSDEERGRVAAGVDGGADNVQDVYPLAPLQEGILFHHLLTRDGDPYLMPTLYTFERREELEAYVAALQAVIDRHDILRTAVVWEGVPEPVQVVWRRARLKVEEVEPDPAEGDAAQALWARFDPQRTRIDVRRAPLIRAATTYDGREGRWVLLLQKHHLIVDHTSLELLLEEVHAHLQGREANRRQVQFMAAHRKTSASRERAQQEVADGQRQQNKAQDLQAAAADLPAWRQLRRVKAEDETGEHQVAHPVRQHAHGQDAGGGAGLQPQPRIQPVTQRHTAHQRAEVEVEHVAHEGDQHHGGRAQSVTGVMPPQQVKTAVKNKAGRGQRPGAQQQGRPVLAKRREHLLPFDGARLIDQQPSDQPEKYHRGCALEPGPPGFGGDAGFGRLCPGCGRGRRPVARVECLA